MSDDRRGKITYNMDRLLLYLFTLTMEVLKDSAASVPELTFKGTKLKTENSTTFHFVCKTNSDFLGCAANFLKNNTREDYLRYDQRTNTCYHSMHSDTFYQGPCMPDICACSSCNKFSLNYTFNFESEMDNISFECDVNIVSNLQKFKGSAVIQFIENNFNNLEPRLKEYIIDQEVLTTRLVTKHTTTDPIQVSEKEKRDYKFKTDHNSVYTLLLLIAVIVGLILAIQIIKMIMKIIFCDRQSTPSKPSVNAMEMGEQEKKYDSLTSPKSAPEEPTTPKRMIMSPVFDTSPDNEDGHTTPSNFITKMKKKQNPENPSSSTKLVTQAVVNTLEEKELSSDNEESIKLLRTECVKCDK